MLLESLIYFSNYIFITQVDEQINEKCINVNYSDDLLIYFLSNKLYSRLCRRLVHYVEDKSLLSKYLIKYSTNLDWVKLLLSIDVPYNIHELFECCYIHGHDEILKDLLDDHTVKPRELHCIAWYGRFDLFKYIVEHDKIVKSEIMSYNQSMYYSLIGGHIEITEYIYNNLFNDDNERRNYIENDSGQALLYSCMHGQLNSVKWLIEHGADIREHDYVCFKMAFNSQHINVMKYLLQLMPEDHRYKLLKPLYLQISYEYSKVGDFLRDELERF